MRNIKRELALILVAVFVFPLSACAGKQPKYVSRQIFAMDTVINIHIDGSDVTPLLDGCENLIYSIESVISKTVENSDVAKLNLGETVECNDITLSLLSVSDAVFKLSDGAFDPTVAPLVTLWQECGKRGSLPTDNEISGALEKVGFGNVSVGDGVVQLKNGAQIDLGGIGKGFAEQAVIEYVDENAEKYSVRCALVDFGGMIGVYGNKPDGNDFNIGIKNPADTGKNIGIVKVRSGYVSVSGDYERFVTIDGANYHHIVNPSTGKPADSGLHEVAVLCGDGALADALSTALFVMGYEKSMELYNSGSLKFEALFVGYDGKVLATPGVDYSPNK